LSQEMTLSLPTQLRRTK